MKNHIVIWLGSLLMLSGCESDLKFRSSFIPCEECTAVKMVNRQSRDTVYFDGKNTMTLRALMRPGHDSLTITRNGVVIVALPNFKPMDDKKKRNMYFESRSSQGLKTMRFHLTDEVEFPLMTSQVIDGVYRVSADTVDVYYRFGK
jgi:hypothetical protein